MLGYQLHSSAAVQATVLLEMTHRVQRVNLVGSTVTQSVLNRQAVVINSVVM
jgi:hypothetical protein